MAIHAKHLGFTVRLPTSPAVDSALRSGRRMASRETQGTLTLTLAPARLFVIDDQGGLAKRAERARNASGLFFSMLCARRGSPVTTR